MKCKATMEMIRRTRNEYGGFLPLELNPGQEFFARYETMLFRFNSVKATLVYLIGRLNCHSIYIPYYYCPSTADAIKNTSIKVCYYHVDDNLKPVDVPDEQGTCVLLVDYFGVRGEQTDALAVSYVYAEVIVDRAHAFYADPIIAPHIHNVYSAKKFFGVPDGSYLISRNAVSSVQIPTEAYTYAGYLMQTYEQGTNAAYIIKKEADRVIADHYDCMSKLTIGLLQNVDYDRVAERRKANYSILHDALCTVNEIILPKKCLAYQYPLLIRERGNSIKKKLVEDKIFVSTLWSGEELMKNGNEFELDMSKHCIFLPMDQRYDELDMKYILGKVKGLIDEDSGHNDS